MLRIIVPLDGSSLAEQSVGHAEAIAKAFPAELTLLRVLEGSDSSLPFDCVDWQLQRRQAEAYLRKLAEPLRAQGLTVRHCVEEGVTARTITRFAETEQADLIVLSRFGRGGITDFGRGSVAQKIVAISTVSVLLVGPTPDGGKRDGLVAYRRALVPVDGSLGSEWALGMGAMIAQAHGAELQVVQIILRPDLPTRIPMTRDLQEVSDRMQRYLRLEAKRRVEELKAQLPHELKVRTSVLAARDPAAAIHAAAEASNVDLIVLSAHSEPGEHGWRYGSVCEALLAHTMRPVLVLQQPDEAVGQRFRSVWLPEQRADAG